MNIVFWSCFRESTCVTSNMLVISAITSFIGAGSRVALVENHYSPNSILNYSFGKKDLEKVAEFDCNYNKYGIETLLRRYSNVDDNSKDIIQSGVPLFSKVLVYFPPNYIVNKEVFDYLFHNNSKELYNDLEQKFSYIFTDVESNHNISTPDMIDKADLIVVNLPQNEQDFQTFFDNYSYLKRKSIFIISKYANGLSFNIDTVRKKYQLDRNQSFIMPYCYELEEAIYHGKVMHFLTKNYTRPESSNVRYLVREATKIALRIRSIRHELES